MASTESKFSFTLDRLAKVECPREQDRIWVYDEKSHGLAFCVTQGGARVFYLYRKINGVPKRIRLGTIGEMNLEQARRRAGELNNQITAGRDPQAEKQAARIEAMKDVATVGNLWLSYHDHHLVNTKPRTLAEFTRLYDAHIAGWKDRPAAGVTLADIETLKIEVGKEHGHYTANRVLAILSSMYRKRGHAFGLPRAWSPTAGIEPFPEMPRDRVLTVEELARIMKAIDSEENVTARDYFQMLLYTGMRKTSVATMAWNDMNIDGGTWKLPGEKTKNGKPLVVNLIPEALAIIKRRYDDNPPDSPFVFPSRRITPAQVEEARKLRDEGHSTHAIAETMGIAQTTVMSILKPDYAPRAPGAFDGAGTIWKRILKRSGITQRTTIHDLRRTFCTAMIERGVPLPIVAAAMGHRTMETTNRHYSIASDKAVSDATRSSMAGLLADVAAAGKAQAKGKGQRKGNAASAA